MQSAPAYQQTHCLNIFEYNANDPPKGKVVTGEAVVCHTRIRSMAQTSLLLLHLLPDF